MSLFLLDRDHLTLFQMGQPQLLQNIARLLTDSLAISVISVEEQLTGLQTALRQAKDDVRREQVYFRMARTVEALAGWLARFTAFACCPDTACAPDRTTSERGQ